MYTADNLGLKGKETNDRVLLKGLLFGCSVSFVLRNLCLGTYSRNRKFTGYLILKCSFSSCKHSFPQANFFLRLQKVDHFSYFCNRFCQDGLLALLYAKSAWVACGVIGYIWCDSTPFRLIALDRVSPSLAT